MHHLTPSLAVLGAISQLSITRPVLEGARTEGNIECRQKLPTGAR